MSTPRWVITRLWPRPDQYDGSDRLKIGATNPRWNLVDQAWLYHSPPNEEQIRRRKQKIERERRAAEEEERRKAKPVYHEARSHTPSTLTPQMVINALRTQGHEQGMSAVDIEVAIRDYVWSLNLNDAGNLPPEQQGRRFKTRNDGEG